MKAELNPVREARFREITEYISDIARERCLHLMDHFKECSTELSARPGTLKEFAAFALTLNTMLDGDKRLMLSISQVDQLYQLLRLYEVHCIIRLPHSPTHSLTHSLTH